MVLGHESCRAVKSAIQQVDVGSINMTSLLNEIEPSIEMTEGIRDEKTKIILLMLSKITLKNHC
ncbi:carbonic anhydrase [Psychroflexus halocasei]|uniref:Carbonic anhydrase n=1 Tax=Psychroflexus halocasei TaxID=908615 RepID=A0A1H3Y7T6_9FLAO|nr:carbonic anhydrase [Psychroflexus halocasei]